MFRWFAIAAVCLVAHEAAAQEGAFSLSTPRSMRRPESAPMATPDGYYAAPTPAGVAAALAPDAPYVPPDSLGLSPEDAERRLSLETHLEALAMHRTSRVGDGLTPLLIGGAYIGIGVAANRADDPIDRYFWSVGSLNIASGFLYFGLASNPERLYLRFMEASPSDQIRLGERTLRTLARKRLASRLLQGGIGVGTTVASLPLLLGGDGFRTDDAFDWVVAVSAGLGLVDSVTTMIRRSEEERRWRNYRGRFEQNSSSAIRTRNALGLMDWVAFPVEGGAYFGLRSRF